MGISFIDIIWLLILLQFFIPVIQRRILMMRRVAQIRRIESTNGSRLITMIHRQETLSFLGLPIVRYIDIEDSERVLRAIHLTPDDLPLQMVLHTPGGIVLAAEQIAQALARHKGRVQVLVPHYAMSGGTLIALAADEIVMDPNAVIGPVDPQLGTTQQAFPAASIVKALETPNANRDDSTLILGDVARKALDQVCGSVRSLVAKRMDDEKAKQLARELTQGRWTHDFPIDVEHAKELGLPVSDQLPAEIYDLMDLYPQAGGRRPGVEYIPVPYRMPPPQPGRRAR